MVAVTLYTVPGTPRPGYRSTCPQARPATPSQNDGVYHPHLLRLPSEEHVMAPHQGHQIGASSPVSRALLVPLQPHPATYIMAVPGPLFILRPWGAFFSYHGQVRTCALSHLSNTCSYLLLSSDIVHFGYLVVLCAGT
jgi:hypothetical protein